MPSPKAKAKKERKGSAKPQEVTFAVYDVVEEKPQKSKGRGARPQSAGGYASSSSRAGGATGVPPAARVRPGTLVPPAVRIARKQRTHIESRRRVDPNPTRRNLWNYEAGLAHVAATVQEGAEGEVTGAAAGPAPPPPAAAAAAAGGGGGGGGGGGRPRSAGVGGRRDKWDVTTAVRGLRAYDPAVDPYEYSKKEGNRDAKSVPLHVSGIGRVGEDRWRRTVAEKTEAALGDRSTVYARKRCWTAAEQLEEVRPPVYF
jgi:hypothetical protein